MQRRLVGIDLGIASAHTVRVLDETGQQVCRHRTGPTVTELSRIENAALAGAAPGTRLEVVLEPTGPAWLPVAVFFQGRGHLVYRVSSAKAADLRRFLSRHAKSNRVDADTLARLPLLDPAGLRPLALPGVQTAALDRRVRATDRLTRAAAEHKVRIKDLVRQLLPATPLTGELGAADLAVLERWADPRALLAAGPARLTTVIAQTSQSQQGAERAAAWRAAAAEALELYAAYPAMPFTDLAAEVTSEVRLLRAVQAELAEHAAHREEAYRWADPGQLARSLPGLARIGAPALVAIVGDAARFPTARQFRSFTGLAPRASETGDTDRKGRPMSKAGPALLRTTLIRAADHARRQDPQLARIYYTQIVERGATHTKALCVVAAALAERAWAVLRRGMPYVICDTDNTPVDPAAAKAIIAERWTVPAAVRARRRSRKNPATRKAGKAPHGVLAGHRSDAPGRRQTRRPSPPAILTPTATPAQDASLTAHLP